MERDAGLFRLKRALPAPAGAWLVAKTVVAMVFAAAAVASIVAAALATGTARVSLGHMLVVALVMTVGVIPFCAIGVFVGRRPGDPQARASRVRDRSRTARRPG